MFKSVAYQCLDGSAPRDVENNRLGFVPSDIGNLVDLETLYVDSNCFIARSPISSLNTSSNTQVASRQRVDRLA